MHAGKHFRVGKRQAILIAMPAQSRGEQLRRGIAHVALGEGLTRRRPQKLGIAKLNDLQPTIVEHEIARVEVEVLHIVLLIKIIEHLGRGADVIDEFAARDARLFARLALVRPAAHRLAHMLGQKDQAARLNVDHLRRQHRRVLHALQTGERFFQPGDIGGSQAVENLDALLGAVRCLRFPHVHQRSVAQALQKAISC